MAVNLRFSEIDLIDTDYGEIHCVESMSCDDLYLSTDSYQTQLYLYQHSDGVVMDNGAGYLSEYDNVVCVTDRWIRFDGLVETEDTVTDSIEEFYADDDSFPCSDVTVLCGNETVSKSCSMTHEITFDEIDHLFDDNSDLCYMVNIQDLQSVSCNGACPSSPTLSPTAAPTQSPSLAPSIAPSAPPTVSPSLAPSMAPSIAPSAAPTDLPTSDPTTDPSADPSSEPTADPTSTPTSAPSAAPTHSPSLSPTMGPTVSPTTDPTNDPTSDPSMDPTRDPTNDPTLDPTTDPTKGPTSDPTMHPTFDPTMVPTAPSVNPTSDPTTDPTSDPTTDPSADPTNIPTKEPTNDPTSEPTPAPTMSPSNTPTNAPTQYPTKTDEYDSYIEVEYQLNGLTNDEMEWIAGSVSIFADNMSDIIESGYDDEDFIEFRNIEVNVTAFNGVEVEALKEYDDDTLRYDAIATVDSVLTVKSYTNCSEFYCNYILGVDSIASNNFNESAFEEFTSDQLRDYFNVMVFGGTDASTGSSVVELDVTDHSSTALSMEVIEGTVLDTEDAYYYWFLVGIAFMFCMTGLMAIVYQKGLIPKMTPKVDSSRWTACLGFGLQIWDFASDILFSYDLWQTASADIFDDANRVTLIAAVGSTVFIIVPYVSNLRVAANIKSFIANNEVW